MLAINITKIPLNIVEIMATHLEEVLSNNLDADLFGLQLCNHKEADMHTYFCMLSILQKVDSNSC